MAHPDANKPVPEHRRRQGFVRDKNTGKLVRTDAARQEARRKGGVESVSYRDLERKGKEGGRYKSAINISHDYLVNMATHHLNQFESLKGFWDDIKTLRDDAMGQRWRYGGEMKNPDKWTDRYIERWLNHNVLEIWRRTHGLEAQMKIEEFKQKFFAESRYKSNPRGWRANYNVKTSKGKKRRHETTSVAHELSPTRRVVTSKVKSRTVRKWLPDTNRSTRYKSNVQTTKKGGFSKTDDHALRGLIGAEIAKKENPEDWKHTKKLNIWPLGKPKGKGKKVKTAEYGIRKQRKHAEDLYAFASGDIARFLDATVDNVGELAREVRQKYNEIKRQLFDSSGDYKQEIREDERLFWGIVERAEPLLDHFETQESELLTSYVDGLERLGMTEDDVSVVDRARIDGVMQDLMEETWKLRETIHDDENQPHLWNEYKGDRKMWKYAEPKKKKKRPTAGESAATAGGVAAGVGLGWGPSRKARAQLGRDIKSGAGKVKSGAGRAKIAGKQGMARAEHAVLITDQKRKTKVMSKRRGKQLIRAARRLKKFAEFAEKERDSKKKRFLKGVSHGAIGATVAGIGLGAVGRRKGIKAVVKRKKALKSRAGRVSARKATGRRDRKYDRAKWGN